MFCPSCGNSVSQYVNFCSKCGARVGNRTDVPTQISRRDDFGEYEKKETAAQSRAEVSPKTNIEPDLGWYSAPSASKEGGRYSHAMYAPPESEPKSRKTGLIVFFSLLAVIVVCAAAVIIGIAANAV